MRFAAILGDPLTNFFPFRQDYQTRIFFYQQAAGLEEQLG
jgi:hypothetical protein